MKNKRLFSRNSFAVLLIWAELLFVTSAVYADWQAVGTAVFSAGLADYISLALDSSNTPYVAYMDLGNINRATVMKYNGGSWVPVGSPGFSAGSAFYTSLALDSSNIPYVAYQDWGNSGKATVKKFDGDSWVTVGNPGFSAGEAEYLGLALDSSNTPHVAYQDWGNSGKATVMKYNGGSWVTVGNPGFSAGEAEYLSLTLDSSNTPYVAYLDRGNGAKATVMKYNGSTWVNVGNAGFSAGVVNFTSLALDSSNTSYVAYLDWGNSIKATVMKYNGSSWVTVGNPGFSAGEAFSTNLALDSSNTPYVAYSDWKNSGKTTVMKYDGSSWVTVGSPGFSAGAVSGTSLALDSSNTPYVAYNSSKATVMKLVQDPTTPPPSTNTGMLIPAVSPIDTAIPSIPTTPPPIETQPELIVEPEAIKPIMPVSEGSTGDSQCPPKNSKLNDICDAKWATIINFHVQERGNLARAIVEGLITNEGWASNLKLKGKGIIKGGVLTGFITCENDNVVTDVEFKGAVLAGCTLEGTILNTSRLKGKGLIRDVKLKAGAKVKGGRLGGKITGDAKSPALLDWLEIDQGSELSHVILGKHVSVAPNVKLDDNVQFE